MSDQSKPPFCIGEYCLTRSGCLASGICDKARPEYLHLAEPATRCADCNLPTPLAELEANGGLCIPCRMAWDQHFKELGQ